MIESLKQYNFLVILIYPALLAAWTIGDEWSGKDKTSILTTG